MVEEHMLRGEGVVVESVWVGTGASTNGREAQGARDIDREIHRDIDRELRRIAKRRAALHAEEARWLREAERHRIWRKLGFATALEYLEDVFGHAPRTAKDRLRVAKSLGELPGLEAALRDGAMPYSAVKELTRVMTPATEAQWLACARGRSVRDIGELVAGRKKGDLPSDPQDPSLLTRDVVFTLDARRQALLEQARAMFEAERGESVDNADLLEALCISALQLGATMTGAAMTDKRALSVTPAANGRRKAPRPSHQIVVRRCDDCTRSWMLSRGKLVEVTRSDVAKCSCDADVVHEVDVAAAQAAGTRRPRPTSTIPTKTRDLVWARDEGRCRFPGCRATRYLELHHIVFQELGGSHDASNLILLCAGHHTQLHDGLVTISGHAPNALVFVRDGKRLLDPRAPDERQATAHLAKLGSPQLGTPQPLHARPAKHATSRFDEVVELEAATQALRQLGYKTRAAHRALAEVRAHVGTDADVPTLVRGVLGLSRRTSHPPAADDESTASLAARALVQLGFSVSLAGHAVSQVCAHVGTNDLATLIKEALRHCHES